MPPKKKKTQLKPVARGFATTSVPKKVVPVVEDPLPEVPTDTGDTSSAAQHAAGPKESTADGGTVEEFSLEKVEEQALQNIVDKLQEKTEKEINRTIKAIEYDRRLAKTFTRLSLEPSVRDRILRLILEEESQASENQLPHFDEPEDKILARIGITYGTLRRLGFGEERVEECLRAIPSFELEDAFNWLYIHSPAEELILDKDMIELKAPRTPRTPQFFPASPSTASMEPRSLLSGLSSTPISSPSFSASETLPNSDAENAVMKKKILATYASHSNDDSPTPTVSSGRTSPDLDPNAEYARIKVQLQLRKMGRPAPGADAQNADEEKRLEALQAHYLFSSKQAEALFNAEHAQAKALALDARLRAVPDVVASDSDTSSNIEATRKRRPPNLNAAQQPSSAKSIKSAVDILEDTDAADSEGIFGTMLDEMPAAETSSAGTVITIRNTALPKHWAAGHTPKGLLKENVQKSDRYAAITYHRVGGASRAARAGVSIRWEGGKDTEWNMETEGCHDERQAEQYVSTIALHSLTFNPLPGFASSISSGAHTYFRLLPPVFRDLWDELEIKRKKGEAATNRQIWGKLRSIVEPRLGPIAKASAKTVKQTPNASDVTPAGPSTNGSDILSEQIKAGFRARQASAGYQDMLAQRNSLPIAAYRREIIDTLETSQVMVLSGETGCGKSTQVPSFILEDHLSRGKHCKIYCTEPRRISAISLAQRVSMELGDPPGSAGTLSSIVGYSIRLESNTTRNTKLAFVTNGIALRMLEGGSGAGGKGTAFDDITHIIIDEVHERSIESDFLLIVLKSLLEQRRDLKIVLMSATLDAEKIAAFFGGCPMLHVPGRTFPVDTRFLEDAIELTKWAITPTSPFAKRQNDKFYRSGKQITFEWSEDTALNEDDEESSDAAQATPAVKLDKRYSSSTISSLNLFDERLIPYELITRLLETICFENQDYLAYSPAILIFMPGLNEIRRLHDLLTEHQIFGNADTFRLYPLHSSISSENQGAVFDIPPFGVRKIVIATNIAETGITIPDITCVIDSGKHREMRFDEKRQISRLVETFIARSNAAQRRGRAGRVQAGLCFHLFTKTRHDTLLAEHPQPEMLRLSLSDLALRIKILKVKIGSSIEDVLSRALDPPSQINVQRAVSALVEVKALTSTEEITPMGRLLSKLPTDVHLGKFLLFSALFGCLDPALTIAATLNAKSPFLTPFGLEEEADRAKNSFKVDDSDFLTIHSAFASWRRVSNNNPGFVRSFCRKNFLSHQNLQQIEELRQQFLGYLIDANFIKVDKSYEKELSRSRYGRSRTRFLPVPPQFDTNATDHSLIRAALAAGLYPKILSVDTALNGTGQMRTITNNQVASFHPSSVNFGRKPKDFESNFLCYFTIMQSKKLYAWETGPVDDIALLLTCGDAEFKLSSDTVLIDRSKLKFHIPPKSNIALKHLRERLTSILSLRMRGKELDKGQETWWELATAVLRHLKVEDEVDGKIGD